MTTSYNYTNLMEQWSCDATMLAQKTPKTTVFKMAAFSLFTTVENVGALLNSLILEKEFLYITLHRIVDSLTLVTFCYINTHDSS